MTPAEAELLIAILTGAEGAFAVTNPPLVAALHDLRPLRTALMQSYLRCRLALPPTDDAVDPHASAEGATDSGTRPTRA